MLETRIIRNGTDQNVVIHDESNQTKNHFATKMIEQNDLEYILKLDVRTIDGEQYCYYDIANKESLSERHEKKKIVFEELMKLFNDVEQMLIATREYLLEPDHVRLEPEYIFFNESHAFFLYVPHMEEDLRQQLQSLLVYLMEKVDYGDKRAVNLTYELFQIVNQDTYTLEYFFEYLGQKKKGKKLVERVEDQIGNQIKKEQNSIEQPPFEPEFCYKPEQAAMPVQTGPVNKPEKKTNPLAICVIVISLVLSSGIAYGLYSYGLLNNEIGNRIDYVKLCVVLIALTVGDFLVIQTVLPKKNKKDEKNKIGKKEVEQNTFVTAQRLPIKSEASVVQPEPEFTTALNPIEPEFTTPLKQQEDQPEQQFLLQAVEKGSYCDLFVYCYPYTLGKSTSQADGIINNTNVSRTHAKIDKQDGVMTIVDLNSTNGTYINNRRIREGEKAKLQAGDEIRIADVEYMLVKC